MIIPASRALTAWRNGVFRMSLTIKGDGIALSIAGYTAKMQLRLYEGAPGSPLLEIHTSGTTTNGSAITITDAAHGRLELLITKLDLEGLPIASPVRSPVTLAYDLVLAPPGGDPNPYARGAFVVVEGVTR